MKYNIWPLWSFETHRSSKTQEASHDGNLAMSVYTILLSPSLACQNNSLIGVHKKLLQAAQ